MILSELMDMLRGVEDGNLEMNAVVAGEVAGTIEILQTKLNRYEELKQKGLLLIIPEFDARALSVWILKRRCRR